MTLQVLVASLLYLAKILYGETVTSAISAITALLSCVIHLSDYHPVNYICQFHT